jgi:hypothetical protein
MTDVWDTEAELLASANGLPLNECREAVILKWMEAGDLRPLRAALLPGDMLGRVIQQYLGAMLLDDDEEFCFIDEQTAGRKTSHQLIVRKRGPGPARKPENFVRDLELSAGVRILTRLGLSVEKAIAEIALKKGCSEGTVKQAYQKYVEADDDK